MSTRTPPRTLNCERCGTEFMGRARKRFCTVKCQRAIVREHYAAQNPHGTPRALVGAMHELTVAADLMRRGFFVFRAMGPHSPGDLFAVKGATRLLVEVTTGGRTRHGRLTYPKHEKTPFDVLAVVEKNGTLTYLPEPCEKPL